MSQTQNPSQQHSDSSLFTGRLITTEQAQAVRGLVRLYQSLDDELRTCAADERGTLEHEQFDVLQQIADLLGTQTTARRTCYLLNMEPEGPYLITVRGHFGNSLLTAVIDQLFTIPDGDDPLVPDMDPDGDHL
jgi:hypothetical protein